MGHNVTFSTQFYALLSCFLLWDVNKIEDAIAVSVETNKTNHLTEASGMYVPVYGQKKSAPEGAPILLV